MRIFWPEKLGPAPEALKKYVLMTGIDTDDPAYRLATDCADAAVAALIERLCFLLEVTDFKTELAEVRKWEITALVAERDELYGEVERLDAFNKLIYEGSAVHRAVEAEAEVERLRCCGNCTHYRHEHLGWCHMEAVDAANYADGCHFTPSRWRERTP